MPPPTKRPLTAYHKLSVNAMINYSHFIIGFSRFLVIGEEKNVTVQVSLCIRKSFGNEINDTK